MRDVYYSLDALLRLGHVEELRRQLALTLMRVGGDGGVPDFIVPEVALGRSIVGLMLDSPYRPWVADTPLHLLISLAKLLKPALRTRRALLVRARVEALRAGPRGMIRGSDYRDSLSFTEALLSNQVDLYLALKAVGEGPEADRLWSYVDEALWDDELGHYRESPRSRRFDLLAHAKLAIHGLVDGYRGELVAEAMLRSLTPYGLVNVRPPYRPEEVRLNWATCVKAHRPKARLKLLISRGVEENARAGYQNGTVWPFAHNMAVEALLRLGYEREALRCLLTLRGFHEYYDPRSGRGGGSAEQLWSAATWLSAYWSLEGEGLL